MTMRYRLHLTTGDDAEVVAARLWGAGALGVQELHDGLLAWFPSRNDRVPPGGRWATEPERDWVRDTREGLDVVTVGRVHVVPSWRSSAAGPDDVTVLLDPGVAFGTGHHATTTLCLGQLQALLRPGASVLDVGTGTGILAIAARLLGAGTTRAVDLDPQAVAAARVNARANGVAVEVARGGLEAVDGTSQLVLANLLTPTLHALAASLVAATAPGGHLVCSGVASGRAAGVAATVADHGAPLVAREDLDGWAVLVHRREPA